MAGRLSGKVSVVTGAAGGIGTAICEAFAAEDATVVLVDINREGLETFFKSFSEKYGNKHLQLCGDASNSDFAKQLFDNVQKKYGTPGEVLVNGAGGTPSVAFMDMTEKLFDDIVNLNLKTVYVMTKAFTEALKTDNGMKKASIVNLASIAGKLAFSNLCAYGAAKAGVIGLSKVVGKELGKYGVRCNAILPSLIETTLIDIFSDEEKQFVLETSPQRRFGKPKEVADACVFLASDESSHITCSCLEITGGYGA